MRFLQTLTRLLTLLMALSGGAQADTAPELEWLLQRLSYIPVREHHVHRKLQGEAVCNTCENQSPKLPPVLLRPAFVHESKSDPDSVVLRFEGLSTRRAGEWPAITVVVSQMALTTALNRFAGWSRGQTHRRFSEFATRGAMEGPRNNWERIAARLEEGAAAEALANLALMPEIQAAFPSVDRLWVHPEAVGDIVLAPTQPIEISPNARLRVNLEFEIEMVNRELLEELSRVLQAIAKLPSAEIQRLGIRLDNESNHVSVLLRAHLLGACERNPQGIEELRRAGFSPDQVEGFIRNRICGRSDMPNPSDFIKPGALGSLAAAVGQFRAVKDDQGKVYIEGLHGLVRQQVRQTAEGAWEQVGSLDTPLPCATAIHNLVTKRRTPSDEQGGK